MPPRPARHRKRILSDSVLFVIVLAVLAIGFGAVAVYQNGSFRDPEFALRETEAKPAEDRGSPGTSESDDVRLADSSDPTRQLTLLYESESHRDVYNALSDSERDSLQRMADAIDETLKGSRYEGELSEEDLALADRYSTLFDPVRRRDYWYQTAQRTPGFSTFEELRHRGDEDEFKSAAMEWAQLDGLTRGLLLEALHAIADENEELQVTLRDAIQQYPFIVGIEAPVAPLRAPRP